jgi:nitroreductase family protein
MLDLDHAIRERHSTRLFLPRPVPRELVDRALVLAQCAPSNSNIQPWHVIFASRACRDRLVAALLDEVRRRPPNIHRPKSFEHYRRDLGAEVYGSMGIALRIRRVTRPRPCATGNFSARHWRASSACIDLSVLQTQ